MVVSSATDRLRRSLSREELELFEREGYLVVDDVFDPAVDLQPVRRLATSTTPVFYRWDSDEPVCA